MTLTGSASVKIGTTSKSFKAEEAYGLALGHGKVTGSTDKASKSIVDDINAQIASAWKKAKATGDAPEVTADDVTWDTYSAK